MNESDCTGLESSGKTVVSYDSSNTGQIVDGGFLHCIELRVLLKRIFLLEDADNLARRLNRVADVAAGEIESRL